MKKVTGIIIAFLLLASTLSSEALAEDYRLSTGDVLSISVWGYDDLQAQEYIVRTDGKIQYPLAGDIQVAGVSPVELNKNLTLVLSDYINNPKVTVNVVKFHTTRIYVLGEVASPGMYEIEKQHNLLDAIGMAGSYTKNAAKKNVFIIRKDQTGKPLKANLLNLIRQGDMTQNYALNEGDVVYLTSNGRISFAADILPWISATYQLNRMNND
jgi:polysaccharide export outer membrane protein